MSFRLMKDWNFSSIYNRWLACSRCPMDTATYAAAAALPRSVIQSKEHPFGPEVDFLPFNLSEIARTWVWRFHTTGPCNDI